MYIPERIPEADREQMIEKANYGSGIELSENVAILVVDFTREFVEDQYPNGFAETGLPAARATARLLDVARENGIRGYYSRGMKGAHPAERGRWDDISPSDEESIERDSNRTEICDILSPAEDDLVLEKYKPSMFFGTQLESMLNYEGIDSLVVTGMTTSGCVRATVVDAFSYNYRVKIPEACVADRSQISHEINLFDMDMKYSDVCPLDDIIAEIEELSAE